MVFASKPVHPSCAWRVAQEQEVDALGGEDAQDGIDDGGLADAGTASDGTFAISARRMASFWLGARLRPVFCSIHGMALSGSIHEFWQVSDHTAMACYQRISPTASAMTSAIRGPAPSG